MTCQPMRVICITSRLSSATGKTLQNVRDVFSDHNEALMRSVKLRAYSWTAFNLYHSLGIFSRRQIDDIFLIFPRKQNLTFHANCLLRRQFA